MSEDLPEKDHFLSYLSKTPGIGGRIKKTPDDFIVEEILEDGTILEKDKTFTRAGTEGNFTHFILQKREWTSEGAIRRIADELRISAKRFSYAGTKDKNAISTQLVSVFGISKEKLLSLNLKDIKILGAWSSSDKTRLGSLLGNRFKIVVHGQNPNEKNAVEVIYKELNGVFPNYFGPQRFGSSRRNTHKLGEYLAKGRHDLAALEFLCECKGETNELAILARKNLRETGDFKKALKEFPKYLHLERALLTHLAVYPRDYAGALRKLPRRILLLFVHAFQSHIFNLALSERIAEGALNKLEEGEYSCGETGGFPDIKKQESHSRWIAGKMIGYETKVNEREKRILEMFDIKPRDFKIKAIPEISSKGTHRTLLSPLKDFSFYNNTFTFSLQSGAYATAALREFLDRDKNDGGGSGV
ncbi:MAG: tRNA pseudouridine(13) synthase TruD [Candidatus Bilamarchaeaceae archaeon]